jgi:hypothetical protein
MSVPRPFDQRLLHVVAIALVVLELVYVTGHWPWDILARVALLKIHVNFTLHTQNGRFGEFKKDASRNPLLREFCKDEIPNFSCQMQETRSQRRCGLLHGFLLLTMGFLRFAYDCVSVRIPQEY